MRVEARRPCLGAIWLTVGLWVMLAAMLAGMASLVVPACGFSTPGGQRLLWFCPARDDAPRTSTELEWERQRQRLLDHRLDNLRLALVTAPDCPSPPPPPPRIARRSEPAPQIVLAEAAPPPPPAPEPEATPARIPAPPVVEPEPATEPEPEVVEAALPAAPEPEPEPQIEMAVYRPEPNPAPDYTPPRPAHRPEAPARPQPPIHPRPAVQPAPQPAPQPTVIPVALPAPAPQPAPPPQPVPVRTQPAPPQPPSDYERRLQRAGVPDRNVMVTLIWDNINDLDLHLICPSGQPIYYANMTACGGRLDVDSNGPGPETSAPVENVSWAQAPSGHYRVVVRHFANHGAPDPTRYRVRVRIDGRDRFYSGSVAPGQENIIAEFDIP